MKTTLKILFESILLAGAVYVNFFDKQLSSRIDENRLLDALISFLIYVLILRLSVSGTRLFYLNQRKTNTEKDNFLIGVRNIYRLLLSIGLVVTIFAFFGIGIQTLLTSLSIVAAAFAIISKEYINDIGIGIYNSFSDNFEIGDYVKIGGGQKGKILEIGLLKLKLLDDNDVSVFIPNSQVYSNEIVNYTKRDFSFMNIDFQMDIQFVKNLELLELELIKSIEKFSEYIVPDSYNLKIVDFKKDHLDFKFQYTLNQMDRELRISIRRQTVRQVFSYITERALD